MSTVRTSPRSSRPRLLYALLAIAAFPAYAQVALPAREPGPQPEPIEEIEVIGQRSLLIYRMEIYRAEERMYAMFNELNGSDDLDVVCERRSPTGSHIAQRSCVRRYMKEAQSRNAADALRGYVTFKSTAELWGENQAYHARFSEQVNTLMQQNPEFVTAIAETVKARDRYAVERRHRAQNTFWGRLLTGQASE